MKRLFTIIFLCGMVFPGHAFAISDSNKESYLKWIKKHGAAWSYALAVAPNGCGWYDSGNSIYEAKRKALRGCKKSCKTTCEIKDVNGNSAFIKQRGSSGSSSYSSTASSLSTRVRWCATVQSVSLKLETWCKRNGGKIFSSQHQAVAEHKRLNAGSTATALSSGNYVWCATPLSASRTLKSWCRRNGKAFPSEYLAKAEHKRLKSGSSSSSSSTVSSSGSKVVWCATANWASKYTERVCKSVGGKSYSSEYLAKAEHKRLKAAYVNLHTCLDGRFPILCDHSLLTAQQLTQVANVETAPNLKKCLDGRYPASCDHSILTAEQLIQVTNAEKAAEVIFLQSIQSLTLIEQGKKLALHKGCVACHSLDGSPSVGPTWKGLVGGRHETLTDGRIVSVDDTYLKESIVNPSAKIVNGYAPIMPPIQLTEDQLDALVAYIKSASVSGIKQSGSFGSTSTASSSGSKVVWCATANWASKYTERVCKSVGGKSYSSEYLAKAEHKRLKATSSTASSSSSTASSSGSNMWWCARITGVTYEDRNKCTTSSGDWFTSRHFAETEHNRLKGLSSTDSSSNSNLVWCASAKWFRYTEYSTCRDEDDGKSYLDKAQAKAEHERLKETVKTAQTTCTPEVDKTYWESVRESKDADMLNAYLKKCPSGEYVELARITLSRLGSTATPDPEPSIPDFDYGRYHALVIGNDRYQHLKNLSTAVNDANAVASLLRSRYQFNVDVLTNATRDETVSALSRLRRTISSKDNLLIYYAGHGWLDKDMDEGFWLPVDAVDDDQVHWIANDTIMRSVRAMKAKHVMVVADSCFSGTLIRGIKFRKRSPDYLKQIVQKKARTALTSGGLEPVSDVGGGNHSVFAATFMRILNENTGVLDGHQLFTTLRKQVMMNADQTPEYGDIRKAGHDGGDFLFVRQ